MTWDDPCPARGAGLRHAHWSECDPKKGHPKSSFVHQYDQCCHCHETIRPAATPSEAPSRPTHSCVFNSVGICTICATYHHFRWSITGACATCGQKEAICRERRLAFEDQLLVEPKAITGQGPTGPRWGKGRWWGEPGELSYNDVARLIFCCEVVRQSVYEPGLPAGEVNERLMAVGPWR